MRRYDHVQWAQDATAMAAAMRMLKEAMDPFQYCILTCACAWVPSSGHPVETVCGCIQIHFTDASRDVSAMLSSAPDGNDEDPMTPASPAGMV